MGWNVPSLATASDDEDFYALLMLAGVLDGGYSARIESNIVRGQRLAAGAGASYQGIARGDGLFTMSASANPGISLEHLENSYWPGGHAMLKNPPAPPDLHRVQHQVWRL